MAEGSIEALGAGDRARALASDIALPFSTFLTVLMKHGGLYTLTDRHIMARRVQALLGASHAIPQFRGSVHLTAFADAFADETGKALDANFFVKLVDTPFEIPSDLITYIADHHRGKVFTSPVLEQTDPQSLLSPGFPAAFTFVGQFVDHDLTLNAINLIEKEGNDVTDFASPLIDLDSVYGPRAKLDKRSDMIFEGNEGFETFRHVTHGGTIDLPRQPLLDGAEWVNVPALFDARNDENQMILQVHLLLERLHNKFVSQGKSFEEAKKNTILNWQSFLLHHYLPALILPATLQTLRADVDAGNFQNMKVARQDAATGRWSLKMPHEFAIAFRIGHSQLRPGYEVNAGSMIRLFDAALYPQAGTYPPQFDDLRGGQTLSAAHAIDWSFFLGAGGGSAQRANAIDGHVTSVVFDLPARTIPDDIKFVRNLPVRNLVRSNMIGLCSGEDLADFYGLTSQNGDKLSNDQVEPDGNWKYLFAPDGVFRTPLWYYLLKEAELLGGNDNHLGPLGSRLVGEVLLCGMRFAPINWWDDRSNAAAWSVNGTDSVSLLDIAAFV